MTASLLLVLKGPMQSWGTDSRFRERDAGIIPSKSGVIGLLAAAEGRERTDPIGDLAALTIAVRIDQPGAVMRDFQTAENPDGTQNLVTRRYLADACFVVAVETDRETAEHLADALRAPRWPLFMGRRSCPVPARLVGGIVDAPAVEALRSWPWQASVLHQQKTGSATLPIIRDATDADVVSGDGRSVQDVPTSFDPDDRRHAWRYVTTDAVGVQVRGGRTADPFFEEVVA